jgi:hypothetical protein
MPLEHDYDVPKAMCWHCDRLLDAAASMDDGPKPEPGAVSLCLYCGAVGVFGPDLMLSAPDKALLDELWGEDEFRQNFVAFNWARQYVMIEHSLMRNREDQDR